MSCVKIQQFGGGGGGASTAAPFVVISAVDEEGLTQERRIVESASIGVTDGGPNGTLSFFVKSGAVPAAGADGFVQFATGGVLDSDSGLKYDKATKKLTLAGVLDPTAVVLSGGTDLYFESGDAPDAGVAPAGKGRLRYSDTAKRWQASADGGAWTSLDIGIEPDPVGPEGAVQFRTGAAFDGDSQLVFDKALGKLTTKLLTLKKDLPLLDMIGGSDASATSSPTIFWNRSRGSEVAPANVALSDRLGTLTAFGYHTGGFRQAAKIEMYVAGGGTLSGTSMPGEIRFLTSPDGSVTGAEALRINSAQQVLTGQLGSASAPALANVTHPDTGWFWSAGPSLRSGVAGDEVSKLESSGVSRRLWIAADAGRAEIYPYSRDDSPSNGPIINSFRGRAGTARVQPGDFLLFLNCNAQNAISLGFSASQIWEVESLSFSNTRVHSKVGWGWMDADGSGRTRQEFAWDGRVSFYAGATSSIFEAFRVEPSTGDLRLDVPNDKIRFDVSNHRLILGSNEADLSPESELGGTGNRLLITGDGEQGDVLLQRYSTDTDGPRLNFSKSRGSLASPANLVVGDSLGELRYLFVNAFPGRGSALDVIARTGAVYTLPGPSQQVRGRLEFHFDDGSTGGNFERIRFEYNGQLQLDDGSAGTPAIAGLNHTGTGLYWVAGPELRGAVGGTELFRWRQGSDPGLEIRNDFRSTVTLKSAHSAQSPNLVMARARGTLASPTILSDGDTIGNLGWSAYTDNYFGAADIVTFVDGTPSTGGSAPARLVFRTNPGLDNNTEAVRIDSSQRVFFSGGADPATLGTDFGQPRHVVILHETGTTGASDPTLDVQSYSGGAGAPTAPLLMGESSRGTIAAPVASAAGDVALQIKGRIHRASPAGTAQGLCDVLFEVDAVSAPNYGGRIRFLATDTSGAGQPELLRLVGTDGQALIGQLGTAAKPSLANLTHTDTGWYWSAGPVLGLSVGGTGIWTYDTAGTFAAAIDGAPTTFMRGHSADAATSPRIVTRRGRGSVATPSAVTADDELFEIAVEGYTGGSPQEAARILFEVDGAVGVGDLPTRIRFLVSPDGAVVAAEALRISNDKSSLFSGLLRQKVHGAFAGSEWRQTTGAVQTTDATATTAASVTLDDDSVYWVEMQVAARGTGGTDRAGYKQFAVVYRQGGGGATIQGGTPLDLATVESDILWDADLTVSGNDVRATVVGAAGTTINWAVTLRYQRVSGSI